LKLRTQTERIKAKVHVISHIEESHVRSRATCAIAAVRNEGA